MFQGPEMRVALRKREDALLQRISVHPRVIDDLYKLLSLWCLSSPREMGGRVLGDRTIAESSRKFR